MELIDHHSHTIVPLRRLSRPHDRSRGIALAAMTGVISGFSIFVNGYGVRRFDDPTTYTTAKNLVAAVLIVTALVIGRRRTRRSPGLDEAPSMTPLHRRAAYLAVAVIGGSLPFVLFFEGFSRASSTDAAFIHKTLVAWVALLAVLVLREHVGPLHGLAIGMILAGYAVSMGGIGFPEFGVGELLMLSATLCWSIEVVIARYVLQQGVAELSLGTARMLGGVGLLLAWAIARGAWGDLAALTLLQWQWALLTGAFLTAYVISWHFALARAQAVDVTAMLVIGAVITALLDAGIRDLPLRPAGIALLGAGALVVGLAALRPRPTMQLSA